MIWDTYNVDQEIENSGYPCFNNITLNYQPEGIEKYPLENIPDSCPIVTTGSGY